MFTTTTRNYFIERFKGSSYKDNFTYEGLNALFDYIEEYETCVGEQIEFDMVALCCDYSEYSSAIEACDQYGLDSFETEEEAISELEEHTTVIDVEYLDNTKGIIIQCF